MDRFLKLVQHTLLKRAVFCLAFVGFLTTGAQAQLLPPVITPPIVLPTVLSSGGSVTNGGIAIITATITTTTSLKGTAWYCNGQLVPASKSSLTSIANLVYASTLTLSNVSSINAGSYTLRATNINILGASSSVSSPAIVVVANLVNTIVSNVVNTASFVAGTVGMTTSGFQFKLNGPTGSNVVIQASSDMIHWTAISTNTFASGQVNFTDAAAKTNVFRYYRTFSP
jgi:hypothetical protein